MRINKKNYRYTNANLETVYRTNTIEPQTFQTEYETTALVYSILLNYNTVSGDTTHRRHYYYTFIHYHFIKYALVLRRSRIPEPEQQKVKSTTIFNLVPLAIIAGNHKNNLNVVRIIKTTTAGCTAVPRRGIHSVQTRRYTR